MTPCSPWEVLLPLSALALVAHLVSLGEAGQTIFGVQTTVEYAASEAHRKLRRAYSRRVLLHTTLAAVVPAVLGYWGVGLGLFVAAWQGMQAGMAWWDAHMEALGHEADPASTPPPASNWEGLAGSRLLGVGPYLLLVGAALYLAVLANADAGQELASFPDWAALLAPFCIGLTACALAALAARSGGREPLALGAQYLLALAAGYNSVQSPDRAYRLYSMPFFYWASITSHSSR